LSKSGTSTERRTDGTATLRVSRDKRSNRGDGTFRSVTDVNNLALPLHHPHLALDLLLHHQPETTHAECLLIKMIN